MPLLNKESATPSQIEGLLRQRMPYTAHLLACEALEKGQLDWSWERLQMEFGPIGKVHPEVFTDLIKAVCLRQLRRGTSGKDDGSTSR